MTTLGILTSMHICAMGLMLFGVSLKAHAQTPLLCHYHLTLKKKYQAYFLAL